MGKKFLISSLILLCSFFIGELAFSSTLTCWSVDSRAIVGYRDSSASRYCSYRYKEARFSVNGAQTGSPPQELIQAGLLSIKNQTIDRKLKDSKTIELAAAILAANRTKQVPEEVTKKT